MGLTLAALNAIPPHVFERGRHYFNENRVTLIAGDPESTLSATVRGSRKYDVDIWRKGRSLVVSCNCPIAVDGETLCKHGVATALAAEAAAALGHAPIDSLEPDGSFFGLEDFGDEPPDVLTRLQAGVMRTRDPMTAGTLRNLVRSSGLRRASDLPKPTRHVVASARSPSTWRDALASPTSGESSELQERMLLWSSGELRFVLDIAASVSDHALQVFVEFREPRASGAWGRWKSAAITESDAPLMPTAALRSAIALATSLRPESQIFRFERNMALGRPSVSNAMTELAMRLLCDSECLYVRREKEGEPTGPVTWDEGAPWELIVHLRHAENGGVLMLLGELRRGEETSSLEDPLGFLSCGLVIHSGRMARIEYHGCFGLLARLRKAGQIQVPRDEAFEVIENLLRERPKLPFTFPQDLGVDVKQLVHVPSLVLRRRASGSHDDLLEAEVRHEYGGNIVASGSSPAVDADGTRQLVRRDLDAELSATAALSALGFKPLFRWTPGHGRQSFLTLPARKVPAVVQALLTTGWKVEAEGKLYRTSTSQSARVTSGIDWFELEGEARFGDEVVPLPALLAALHDGEKLVRLGDGSFGILPEKWLARLESLAEFGDESASGLRFVRAQVGLLDALLAEMPDLGADEAFTRARAKLVQFEGVRPADAPASFIGTLREYQREGLGWMRALRELGLGGVLADDMGLGKTVQVLALLLGLKKRRSKKPSLVVAPRSVIFNWCAEAGRFVPKLSVLDHSGLGRSKSESAFKGVDVVLTTYGTLKRDILLFKKAEFDVIVLDEAQAIKNKASETAKAVRLLSGEQRLALSGTPIENHLGELWSLFEFLNPGLLGSATAFGRLVKQGRDVDEPTRRLIAGAVRPFVLRRTKGQVAPELPERIEQTVPCMLDESQRRLYDELRTHYQASLMQQIGAQGLERSKVFVLEALLRLRQAACHPGLIDPRRAGEPSAKLDVLIPELQEVLEEGHGVLVFSQFTSFLAIVRERLEMLDLAHAYLDGQTPAKQRAREVERFQAGEVPLFLISLKAGGLGLNLTRAEYVFLLDPWWNPAVEAQAIDRAHRIGQHRTVVARRLVAQDTVEERILELQVSKRELADAILSSEGSVLGRLTREDLDLLLR